MFDFYLNLVLLLHGVALGLYFLLELHQVLYNFYHSVIIWLTSLVGHHVVSSIPASCDTSLTHETVRASMGQRGRAERDL